MQVVHVVCPSCGGHAIVRNPALPPQKNNESLIRVVCNNCGFNKRLDEKRNSVMFSSPLTAPVGTRNGKRKKLILFCVPRIKAGDILIQIDTVNKLSYEK